MSEASSVLTRDTINRALVLDLMGRGGGSLTLQNDDHDHPRGGND
ncbi:hypothetical protein ACIBF5_26620 [Micromonospora sp. NPDC050417]